MRVGVFEDRVQYTLDYVVSNLAEDSSGSFQLAVVVGNEWTWFDGPSVAGPSSHSGELSFETPLDDARVSVSVIGERDDTTTGVKTRRTFSRFTAVSREAVDFFKEFGFGHENDADYPLSLSFPLSKGTPEDPYRVWFRLGAEGRYRDSFERLFNEYADRVEIAIDFIEVEPGTIGEGTMAGDIADIQVTVQDQFKTTTSPGAVGYAWDWRTGVIAQTTIIIHATPASDVLEGIINAEVFTALFGLSRESTDPAFRGRTTLYFISEGLVPNPSPLDIELARMDRTVGPGVTVEDIDRLIEQGEIFVLE